MNPSSRAEAFDAARDVAVPARRRPLLLCLSHLRWDFVFQRPQHLLSRATASYEVVFLEEPVGAAPGQPPRLETHLTAQGVLVATPVLSYDLTATEAEQAQRILLDELIEERATPPSVVWYYTPMALPFSRHLRPDVSVYDCMDELSLFSGAPPRLGALEQELIDRVDLVFTGGRSLYAAKRHRHPGTHLFPSSVDVGHFLPARERLAEPEDQVGLPRPRLGYFGVIDERVDLELVAGVAALRPDWQIVMVGPLAKLDPATLPQQPNLHWLGGKSYASLPAYLAGWDVGLMPFALNEATRFISPTKTPEYLAAGVPVVSTAVADVVHDWGEAGLVEIAADPASFIEAAERVMARSCAPWLAQVDQRLADLSWDHSWAGMQALIDAVRCASAAISPTGVQAVV
jgi:glycosyltransferase involved in cell wall biosynthesis